MAVRSRLLIIGCVALTACTTSSAVRTSQNTAMITTNAAPVCGGAGASKVAEKQAAIETIRAGFDRYIIVAANNQDNVRLYQQPGSFYAASGYGSSAVGYNPGATVVYGSYDQGMSITMYHERDAGAENALSARETLGPKWSSIVKNGINSCL